jgi:thiol:disulfide interchange protein DsbD
MLASLALSLLAAAPSDVKVEALPDVSHLQPGTTAHVGVHFTIPEHWHIYWENPGDSGLATTVAVEATEGVEVGALRYPAPVELELPGDITSYGYEGEVVLFVPVTVPQDSDLTRVRLKLHARWLVCKESCVLGEADLKVDLRVRAEEPTSANAQRLAASKERLPRSLKKLGLASTWGTAEGGEWTLRLALEGADALAFFPGAGAPLALQAQRAVARDGGAALELRYAAPEAPDARAARGVLEVRRGEARRYFTLDLARPTER